MPPQACLNVGEIPTGIVPGAGRIGAADSSGSQNSGPCHGITRSSPSDQVPRLLFWDWPWASCNHKRRKAQKPSTKVTPLSWHGALRWLHHHHPWEPLPNREEYPLPLSNSQSRVLALLGLDLLQIPSLLEPWCSSVPPNGNDSSFAVPFLCFCGQPPLSHSVRVRDRLCASGTHPTLLSLSPQQPRSAGESSAFPRSATMANSQVQCRCFSYLSTPFPQQEPCVVSDAGKEGSLRPDRWS